MVTCPFGIQQDEPGKPPTVDRADGEPWLLRHVEMGVQQFSHLWHLIEAPARLILSVSLAFHMPPYPKSIADHGVHSLAPCSVDGERGGVHVGTAVMLLTLRGRIGVFGQRF